MEKLFHAKGKQKRAVVAIYSIDKIGFLSKAVTREKKGDYIKIKESIHQEDDTTANIYQFIKKMTQLQIYT